MARNGAGVPVAVGVSEARKLVESNSTAYNGAAGSSTVVKRSDQQTLTAVVENKAGVLARVVGLFARRGFNITSLAVAPTDDERFSRITFVYDIGSAPVEQVVSQVNKLINVVSIKALDPIESVERELLLVQVCAASGFRSEVIELAGAFDAKVAEVGQSGITLMLAGLPDKLDEFIELMRPYGIVEMQRSGPIALSALQPLDPHPASAD